jgi:hypothetical protein
MRHYPLPLRIAGLLCLVAALLALPGCGLSLASLFAGAGLSHASDSATNDANAAARSAQAQADRLAGALNHDVPPTGLPTVHWVEDTARGASANAPSTPSAAPATQPAPKTAALTTTPPALSAERQAIVDQIRQVIRSSNDPALIRALSAVMVTATQPGATLDPADLTGLDAGKHALVLSFYQALQAAPAPAASATANPEPETPAADATAAARPGTLKVRTLLLCRRVKGYGVYDTFDSATFLAGREQKVVIYVELDNFKSLRNAQGIYEVKLSQEVQLYNDADGLKVWGEPAVAILDQSRNQRRDFFVVETVQLPARLTVGKYQMKVRVHDRAADTVDEATVPLSVVADPTLLSSSPPDHLP